jgi:Gpi18-like mannosyltransferase
MINFAYKAMSALEYVFLQWIGSSYWNILYPRGFCGNKMLIEILILGHQKQTE